MLALYDALTNKMMKIYVISILLLSVRCDEPSFLVTKAYTDYLRRHVSWTVLDYESNPFRGWTAEDLDLLHPSLDEISPVWPHVSSLPLLPRTDWINHECTYAPLALGGCSWPHSTVSMISERCCLSGTDFGMLSVQEVISCDRASSGCGGGWPKWALDYVLTARGLVSRDCFPWKKADVPCPDKCENKETWSSSHVCNCLGGYSTLTSVARMAEALRSGPIVASFGICSSFMTYGGGIYHCNCEDLYLGVLPAEIVGFDSQPECHFIGKGPWGTRWGSNGYFKIGCEDCGINGKYPLGNVYCKTVVRSVKQ